MIDWRRAVVFTHRWLGIAGSLLFAAWFASGIVMMYARMPELDPRERLERQPRLRTADVHLTPLDAAAQHQISPERVTLSAVQGRPAYHFAVRGTRTIVFADTGERFDGFSRDQALAEAARFAPEHAATLVYDARITEPDQWTLQSRALLPMHRIALGDAARAVVYLSEVSGEVAVKTTARDRRIAYAGAVLHWLYFTPFRKHSAIWAQSIIWLSLAGSVMCALGLVWGFYSGLASPYRGWMRWHHYAGLLFGLVSFTWVFSGLLSMDPWDWHPSTTPTRAQREAFTGGTLNVSEMRVPPGIDAAEIEWIQFRGQVTTIADGQGTQTFDRAALLGAARDAMGGAPVDEAKWLDAYDSYYYDRAGGLALPVFRVRFADPARTWLYVDPRRGTIVRKEERLSRLNRWLYHGLHSLDFPWLYRRRPLWDIVVIVLSLGGIASVVTSLVPAWRRLRRHAQRLYS